MGDRLIVENRMAPTEAVATVAGQDVIVGLSQPHKALPPKYFYDARGSELLSKLPNCRNII